MIYFIFIQPQGIKKYYKSSIKGKGKGGIINRYD